MLKLAISEPFDYIDGGPGHCSDGGNATTGTSPRLLPCFFFDSSSYSECESACNALEGCIAFDLGKNSKCNLRFPSKAALFAIPDPGYEKWFQGCRSDCESNYEGLGGSKGRCWIKFKGNFVLLSLRLTNHIILEIYSS